MSISICITDWGNDFKLETFVVDFGKARVKTLSRKITSHDMAHVPNTHADTLTHTFKVPLPHYYHHHPLDLTHSLTSQ